MPSAPQLEYVYASLSSNITYIYVIVVSKFLLSMCGFI